MPTTKPLSFLGNVDHGVLLLGIFYRELGHSLVEIGVKDSAAGRNRFNAALLEVVHQLIVDQLRSLDGGTSGFRFPEHLQGTLAIVHHRQETRKDVAAGIVDQFEPFLGRAAAVIVPFRLQTQVLVLGLGGFFAGLFQRIQRFLQIGGQGLDPGGLLGDLAFLAILLGDRLLLLSGL